MVPDPVSEAVESDGPAFLTRLRTARDAMLDRLVSALDQDERVGAVWLSGSIGRGTADDWSDLDLVCVVRGDGFGDWLRDLDGLYRGVGTPLLVGPLRDLHGDGEGRSQSVLFAGPVALDLDILPESTASRPLDTRFVFDRITVQSSLSVQPDDDARTRLIAEALGFFWAMTPIALKFIGRGATARAVTHTDLLRNTFVRLWRLTHQPDRLGAGSANWLHPVEDAELLRRLTRPEAVIDPAQALTTVRRLMAQVSLLHPAIVERGVPIPTAAVGEVESFLDAVISMHPLAGRPHRPGRVAGRRQVHREDPRSDIPTR